MDRRMPSVALALVLAAVLCAGRAAAQSGCTTAIVGLAPCMTYIVGNSSAPASPCCTQLAGVVRSQPQCLCMVLNGGAAQLGLTINQTRALALPGACNVQTPSVSLCNAVSGGPAASPAGSPKAAPAPPSPAAPSEPSNPTPAAPSTPSVPSGSSPSTPSTPATNVAPSGSGSKTTEASGGSSTPMAMLPFFMLISVASCALNLGTF